MPGTTLNQYERIDANSTNRHRHIIPLPGGATGVIEFMDGQPQSTGDEYYLLSDLLGSSTVVLSRLGTSGGVTETYAYDAWGNPRDPDTWNTYGFQTAWPSYIGNRGYGGHDMLEDVSMVHMGGRIYDPVTSRFLSPDPNVQSPNNLQNYNRYTYVLNNPMSYTDPSGFLFNKIAGWVGDVFSGIGDALGSMWKSIRPYVGTIVTVVLSAFPATAPFAGLIGGAVGAIANGGSVGDFLMGMGIGMFSGAIAQDWATSIGGYFSLASDQIGQAMISGAVIGAVSGAMSAAVYGQNLWKGMRNGAAWGSATAAMVHLVRPAPKVEQESQESGRGQGQRIAQEPPGVSDEVNVFKRLDLFVEENTLKGVIKVDVSRVSDTTFLQDAFEGFYAINQSGNGYAIELTIVPVYSSIGADLTLINGGSSGGASGLMVRSGRWFWERRTIYLFPRNPGYTQATATHEFGHFLGLHHQRNATMSFMSYHPNRHNVPVYEDIRRLVEAYR